MDDHETIKDVVRLRYQDDETVETYDEDCHKYVYQMYRHFFESSMISNKIKLLNQYGLKPKVLDIGCGTGRIFKEIIHNDIYYHGIDSSNKMMNCLKKKAKENNIPIKLQTGDATRLPYKNNSFDLCFSMHLTWQLPQNLQIKIIEEMWRVTKHEGFIIFDIMNDSFLWERFKRLFTGKNFHGVYKMNPRLINEKLDKNFSIKKINDFHIKDFILYGVFHNMNTLRKILPRDFFTRLYYVVNVNKSMSSKEFRSKNFVPNNRICR